MPSIFVLLILGIGLLLAERVIEPNSLLSENSLVRNNKKIIVFPSPDYNKVILFVLVFWASVCLVFLAGWFFFIIGNYIPRKIYIISVGITAGALIGSRFPYRLNLYSFSVLKNNISSVVVKGLGGVMASKEKLGHNTEFRSCSNLFTHFHTLSRHIYILLMGSMFVKEQHVRR